MSLVFVLLTHKGAAQTARLVRAIHAPDNYYLIHADLRSGLRFRQELIDALRDLPNVMYLPSRRCWWGGGSLIDATMRGISYACHALTGWSHVINLSGQDFPLANQPEIRGFLEARPDANYLTWWDPVQSLWWSPDAPPRINSIGLELPFARRYHRLPYYHRHFPWWDTRWLIGSQWFMLSRACCDYLVREPRVASLYRFFRQSVIPDESFFQTAICSSPFAETVCNENKRTAIKVGGDVVRLEDYDALCASGGFFARKFDAAIDSAILDRLEARLNSDRADLSSAS